MATKRRGDNDPKSARDYVSTKSMLIAMAIVIICFALILLMLTPPRLVLSSRSPDQTMKLELWTRGGMGPTWADLIWLKQWKKEHVYQGPGDEVRWSNDVEVVWAKDSSQFFIASTKMGGQIYSNLAKNPYLYLTDKSESGSSLRQRYPAVVLTYDIQKKELRHNLHRTLRPFDRRDLKNIDWVRKLPE